MSRLGKAWKYPWILAGWKMSAFIFYPERRTHQDADILSSSFLQDRCGRSWLSRATCVLLLSSLTNVVKFPSFERFKLKRKGSLCIVCAFIMERLQRILYDVLGRVGALLRTTCIHWKSTDGSGFSSGGSRGGGSGPAPWRQTTETRPTLAGKGNFTPGGGVGSCGEKGWKPLDVTRLLRRSV